MIETHPFGVFVPAKTKYLLLGSFTTKEAYDASKVYEWFYSNGRNQFWPIMEAVYGKEIKTRTEMQQLFVNLNMASADIIYQCERKKTSNLDINLTNIVYALDDISAIFDNAKIDKVFFTSRFVENKYRQIFKHILSHYPDIEYITLPSPSPRYAVMRKEDKIKKYREVLPRLVE